MRPHYHKLYVLLCEQPADTGRVLRARVVTAMERVGVTAHALATATGTAHTTWSRRLEGSRPLSVEELEQLNEPLSLSPGELLRPILLPGDVGLLNAIAAAERYNAAGNLISGRTPETWPELCAVHDCDPHAWARLAAQDLVALETVDDHQVITVRPHAHPLLTLVF